MGWMMCVHDRISRWSTPTGAWRCSCGCWTGPLDQRFASLPRLQSSTLAGWCSRRTRMRACLRLCTSSLQISLYPPGALCLLCPVFAFKYSRLPSFCIQIFTSVQFLHSNIHVCPRAHGNAHSNTQQREAAEWLCGVGVAGGRGSKAGSSVRRRLGHREREKICFWGPEAGGGINWQGSAREQGSHLTLTNKHST